MGLNSVIAGLVGKIFDNRIPGGLTIAESSTYIDRDMSAYNSTTGAPTVTTTNTTLSIIYGQYNLREIAASGGLVQNGDVWGLIEASALGKEPKPDDYITDPQSRTLRIISYEEIRLHGSDLLYRVQLRRVD